MAVREVLKMGDPRLLAKAKSVVEPGTEEINNLIRDMRDTMHECDHLDGILYPMRMDDMSKFGFEDALT